MNNMAHEGYIKDLNQQEYWKDRYITVEEIDSKLRFTTIKLEDVGLLT